MIKIGAVFLNNGNWRGEQIISQDWVNQSTKPYPGNDNIKIPGSDYGKNGYSYSWWTKTIFHKGKSTKTFRAGGWGGQQIIILRELDMVVVFTGGNYTSRTHLYNILKGYIIPAIG